MKLEKPIDIQVFYTTPNTSFKFINIDRLQRTKELYIIGRGEEDIAIIERRNVTQILKV